MCRNKIKPFSKRMRNRVGRTWVLWSFLITKSSILKNGGILPPRDDTSWFEIIQDHDLMRQVFVLSPPFRFCSFPSNWANDLRLLTRPISNKPDLCWNEIPNNIYLWLKAVSDQFHIWSNKNPNSQVLTEMSLTTIK